MLSKIIAHVLLLLILSLSLVNCVGKPVTEVIVGVKPPNSVKTAAYSSVESSWGDIVKPIKSELNNYGIAMTDQVSIGQRRSEKNDIVIEADSQKKGDFFIYNKSIEIRIYNAETGILIVGGRWVNSYNHGKPDQDLVIRNLFSEMFAVYPDSFPRRINGVP